MQFFFFLICLTWSFNNNSINKLFGEENITQSLRIIDGDSIQIDNLKYRLFGIDAPEIKQKCKIDNQFYECGQKYRDFLLNLIKKKKIKCKKKDFDRYKRIIAICYANDANINREMVRSGWAIAYRRYSKIFVIDEDFAKKEKKGIWRGEFIQPSEWRRSNKLRK